MHIKQMKIVSILLSLLPGMMVAQSSYKSFAEFGTTIHAGDNTPLWQISNQHGLSSLDNNAYLRGGTIYSDTCQYWKFEAGLDLAVATGFTSTLFCNKHMQIFIISGWDYQ
jgi:hypothetical protein